jgi:hypothetical protein
VEIPWPFERCIVCLKTGTLTLEHLIPEALGGDLTCRFVCNACNSHLGHRHEGNAKRDPTVRLLVEQLGAELPKLSLLLREGQNYFTTGPGPRARGSMKKGSLVVHGAKLNDGSLIQHTPLAERTILKLLSQEGLSPTEIAQAVARFQAAPEDTRVSLSPTIEVVKWSISALQPALDGPLMKALVPVKTAYEYLALHVGPSIYEESPPLQAIRHALQTGVIRIDFISVDRLHAPAAKPFHGLLFEGNRPHAQFQVRLFGKLAFRVHFHRLSVGGPRGMYTHDLANNFESVSALPSDDA